MSSFFMFWHLIKKKKTKLQMVKKVAFLFEEILCLTYTKLTGSLCESWMIVIRRLCKWLIVSSKSQEKNTNNRVARRKKKVVAR